MPIAKIKKQQFSGTSKIFDGTLEKKLNEIIDATNAGGGGGAGFTDADAVDAIKSKAEVAALAPVAVADATDEPTAVALANANKAAINAIIAALKA